MVKGIHTAIDDRVYFLIFLLFSWEKGENIIVDSIRFRVFIFSHYYHNALHATCPFVWRNFKSRFDISSNSDDPSCPNGNADWLHISLSGFFRRQPQRGHMMSPFVQQLWTPSQQQQPPGTCVQRSRSHSAGAAGLHSGSASVRFFVDEQAWKQRFQHSQTTRVTTNNNINNNNNNSEVRIVYVCVCVCVWASTCRISCVLRIDSFRLLRPSFNITHYWSVEWSSDDITMASQAAER